VRVAGVATLLAALLAIPLAYYLVRARFWGRSLVEGFLLLPLVLPPTVIGYYLLVVLGRRGWLGQYLDRWFDYSITFHWHGAVVAATVVAFPLLYLSARAGFAQVDRELEDVARLQGANHWQLLWHVSLPLAARGIMAGLVLAFARALGEFGATLMLVGTGSKTQTLPLVIYFYHETNQDQLGLLTALTLSGVALVMVGIYNRSFFSRQSS